MRSTNPILRFLGSLKLTILCLFLLMLLIFVGTLSQVNLGIYEVQHQYFNAWVVFHDVFGISIPVMPGGALVGSVLIVNLLIGIFFRLKWSVKSFGLLLTHWGLLVLLVGGGLSSALVTESQMAISENSSSNYSIHLKLSELAIIRKDLPDKDVVTSIPEFVLKQESQLVIKELPFQVKILKFLPNAHVQMTPFLDADPSLPKVTQDLGAMVYVKPLTTFKTDDMQNNASTYVELIQEKHSLGIWFIAMSLGKPQQVKVGDAVYELSMRPMRFYNPYTLFLKDFKHDVYPGTTIPKNFSSHVRILNPEKGEDREVDIYMNNPLRYEGKTYYQASFANNNTVSIFQVVENPSWLLPYISCTLMSLGLLYHFILHLFYFLKRKQNA